MNFKRSLAGGLWILLWVVPAWAQSVDIKSDPDANFSAYKNYAWKERKLLTMQAKESEEAMDHALVSAFDAQLNAKGFTDDPKAPDFYLTYRGGSTIADAKAGHAYAPYDLAGYGVTGMWTSNAIPGSVSNVWVSMEGVLLVEIIDAKTQKVVWSNTLRKKIKNPGKFPKDLEKVSGEIASKALKGFPPGGKSQ